MQDAGLLPSTCPPADAPSAPCINATTIASATAALRAAIGNRFADSATGLFVDWFGCEALGNPGATVLDCGLQYVHNGLCTNATACGGLNTVIADFVPTSALMVKLGVPAGGTNFSATLSHFQSLRDDAGKVGPGYWRTNAIGLEETSPLTFQPSAAWALTTPDGFAIRSVNETGDWHMFGRQGGDGYGEWGNQGENGGRFWTTSAMVWEASSIAGPYAEAYSDWRRLVVGLTDVGNQLAANDTSAPLSSNDPTFIATPATDPLVNYLCVAVRQKAGFKNVTDAWGNILCDYYQDVGWSTPENGVALYSFIKGIIGLQVGASGNVTLFGTPLPLCSSAAGAITVALPGSSVWPAEVANVSILGLMVGGRNATIACSHAGSAPFQLQCSSSCS